MTYFTLSQAIGYLVVVIFYILIIWRNYYKIDRVEKKLDELISKNNKGEAYILT